MSVPASRPATYEDILALPEHLVGELIGGELIVSPRLASPHAFAASALGVFLGGPFVWGGGPGGWWILLGPELHLDSDVQVPDWAGWRRERMARVPEVAYFTLAPDWVCEVISNSTRRIDRLRKLPRYAAAGVQFVWLLDPIDRTLEVFKLAGATFSLTATFEGTAEVRGEPFEAIALDLGKLWR